MTLQHSKLKNSSVLTTMTIKTVSSYCCSIFCAIIIVLSVATNYWVEFGTKDAKFREGLFERCDTTDICTDEPAVVGDQTLSGFSSMWFSRVVVNCFLFSA